MTWDQHGENGLGVSVIPPTKVSDLSISSPTSSPWIIFFWRIFEESISNNFNVCISQIKKFGTVCDS